MRLKTAKFTAEDEALFDEFLAEKQKAAELSKHDDRRKAIGKELVAKMGEFTHARFPSGRVIERVAKKRQIAAKAAYEQSWDEIHEVQMP